MPPSSENTSTNSLLPVVDFLKIPEDGEPYLEGSRCAQCGATFLGERSACSSCGARDQLESIRLADQGERARPPWEGWRHDPMPPSSPGETPAGPSTLSEAAVPVGGDAEARPRPKKRHQKRLQRPSGDARLANKRANQGEPEPWECAGGGTPGREAE